MFNNQYNYCGHFYKDDIDYSNYKNTLESQSYKFFIKDCNDNNANSCFMAGEINKNIADRVDKNFDLYYHFYSNARKYYEKACKLGSTDACNK